MIKDEINKQKEKNEIRIQNYNPLQNNNDTFCTYSDLNLLNSLY